MHTSCISISVLCQISSTITPSLLLLQVIAPFYSKYEPIQVSSPPPYFRVQTPQIQFCPLSKGIQGFQIPSLLLSLVLLVLLSTAEKRRIHKVTGWVLRGEATSEVRGTFSSIRTSGRTATCSPSASPGRSGGRLSRLQQVYFLFQLFK